MRSTQQQDAMLEDEWEPPQGPPGAEFCNLPIVTVAPLAVVTPAKFSTSLTLYDRWFLDECGIDTGTLR
jgi:hypothetical protein